MTPQPVRAAPRAQGWHTRAARQATWDARSTAPAPIRPLCPHTHAATAHTSQALLLSVPRGCRPLTIARILAWTLAGTNSKVKKNSLCTYEIHGCTDSAADNYVSYATVPYAGMCQYAGCNDTEAANFNPTVRPSTFLPPPSLPGPCRTLMTPPKSRTLPRLIKPLGALAHL